MARSENAMRTPHSWNRLHVYTETSLVPRRIRAGNDGVGDGDGDGTRLCKDRKADTLIARLEEAVSKERYWKGGKSIDGKILSSHRRSLRLLTGHRERHSREVRQLQGI